MVNKIFIFLYFILIIILNVSCEQNFSPSNISEDKKEKTSFSPKVHLGQKKIDLTKLNITTPGKSKNTSSGSSELKITKKTEDYYAPGFRDVAIKWKEKLPEENRNTLIKIKGIFCTEKVDIYKENQTTKCSEEYTFEKEIESGIPNDFNYSSVIGLPDINNNSKNLYHYSYITIEFFIDNNQKNEPPEITDLEFIYLNPQDTPKKKLDGINNYSSASYRHLEELNRGNIYSFLQSTEIKKPPIIGRHTWLADESITKSTKCGSYHKALIHHTVSSINRKDFASLIRSIQTYHIRIRGWSDIGYNYLLDPNGIIYEGRKSPSDKSPCDVIGAHITNHNSNYLGLAFVGNYNENYPSEKILNSAVEFLTWWFKEKNILSKEKLNKKEELKQTFKDKYLKGHKDLKSTICPGSFLYNLISNDQNSDSSSDNEKIKESLISRILNKYENYLSYNNSNFFFLTLQDTGTNKFNKENIRYLSTQNVCLPSQKFLTQDVFYVDCNNKQDNYNNIIELHFNGQNITNSSYNLYAWIPVEGLEGLDKKNIKINYSLSFAYSTISRSKIKETYSVPINQNEGESGTIKIKDEKDDITCHSESEESNNNDSGDNFQGYWKLIRPIEFYLKNDIIHLSISSEEICKNNQDSIALFTPFMLKKNESN